MTVSASKRWGAGVWSSEEDCQREEGLGFEPGLERLPVKSCILFKVPTSEGRDSVRWN
jgi:hypothetical protein